MPKNVPSNLCIVSKFTFTNLLFSAIIKEVQRIQRNSTSVNEFTSRKGAGRMEMKRFNREMKAETDRTHIGPYNAWLEDGSLHIYGHPVGQGTGSNVSMTPQETLRFLEWLSRNQEILAHVRSL